MIDLRRAHSAAEAARDALGKRQLPAPYPHDPAAQAAAAMEKRRRREYDAVLINTRDGLVRLLDDAVELERQAQNAQARAVEGLRFLGAASLSWDQIGRILGISGAGAHKRLRSVAGPAAQRTIDDLERELGPDEEPQA